MCGHILASQRYKNKQKQNKTKRDSNSKKGKQNNKQTNNAKQSKQLHKQKQNIKHSTAHNLFYG